MPNAKITHFGYMVMFEPPRVSIEERKRMIEESDKQLKAMLEEVRMLYGKGVGQ